jgi:hypothetical protein
LPLPLCTFLCCNIGSSLTITALSIRDYVADFQARPKKHSVLAFGNALGMFMV